MRASLNSHPMISTLLFIALTAFLDPWSVTEKAPVMKEEGFWNQRFEYGFYFYQKVLLLASLLALTQYNQQEYLFPKEEQQPRA